MSDEKKTKTSKKDREKDKQIQEKHVVMVDTKETVENIDDELTDRINRLYGLSSTPGKPQKQYDPKELEETRKKLVFLLMAVVIFGFFVIILLISPFDFDKKSGSNTQSDDTPAVEDKKDEELPIGDIDLSNEKVIELNSIVTFSNNDFMKIDLFPLYSNSILESNNIPNNIKLYILKKTNLFYELLEKTGIEEYIKTCDVNGLVLPKKEFDNVLAKVFGPDTTVEYTNIDYTYYFLGSDSKNVTLSYVNDQYLIKCNEPITNNTMTKYVQQNLTKAVKTENAIEIYQNVVFINQSGVYKDPNFNELITNDVKATFADYISKGVTYKYTFIEDGDNYYLSKLEKVN